MAPASFLTRKREGEREGGGEGQGPLGQHPWGPPAMDCNLECDLTATVTMAALGGALGAQPWVLEPTGAHPPPLPTAPCCWLL